MDKKKTTVAVMMRDVGSDFSEVMYSGLVDAAKEENVNIVFLLGPQSPGEDKVIEDDEIDDEYVDQLDSVYDYVGILKPDVLIIVSGSLKKSRILPDINALVERYKGIPMLVLETRPVKPSIAYQVAESYQAMCECVEHIIVDHRRNFIVYVSGNPKEYDFKERLRAFKDTMNAHSLDFHDDQIIICDSPERDEWRINAIFDDFPYVDAVICSCDRYARMVYRACNKRGIQVGREVAVTGFDDVNMSHVMNPELTGVMYDSYRFGHEALKRALRVAAGERLGGVKIQCHFIKRCSCGCMERRQPVKHEGGPAPVSDSIKADLIRYMDEGIDKAVDAIYSVLPYEAEKQSFKSVYSEMFHKIYDTMFTPWDDLDDVLACLNNYIFMLAGYREISFRMVSDKSCDILENMMGMVPYGKIRSKLTTMILEAVKGLKETEIVRMRERGNIRREHLWFIPLFTKDLLTESKSEVDVLTSIMRRLQGMNVKSGHFFIFNKPVVYKKDQLPPAPSMLNHAGFFDRDSVRVFLRQNGVGIDNKNGISSVLSDDEPRAYAAYAICSGNREYGIALYEVDRDDIFFAMLCTLQIGALFHFRDTSYAAREVDKEVKIKTELLGYVSYKDDLTGVLNGIGFMDKLTKLIYDNNREKAFLFFADVAHMHEINSHFGHEAGDEALRCAAQSLSAILGEENLLARVGDDEFISVILSENCDIIDSIKKSVNRVIGEYNSGSENPYELELLMDAYPFVCEPGMDVAGLLKEAAVVMEKDLKATVDFKLKKTSAGGYSNAYNIL